MNNIGHYLKFIYQWVQGFICHNNTLIDKINDPNCKITNFRIFLNKLNDSGYIFDQSIYEKIHLKTINKEKLFCLNCSILMQNKTFPNNVKEILKDFFMGHYKVEINSEEAFIIFKSLKYSSKIFIEEQNSIFKQVLSSKN